MTQCLLKAVPFFPRSATLTRFPVLALAILAAGCGGGETNPPLNVHPVKGVLLTNAGQPVAGGAIEFVKQSDPPQNARSEVGPAGRFTLFSMTADGQKFAGAEAGEYRVIYSPATDDQTVPPVELPAKVTIQAGDNDLKLSLPK